MNSEESAQTQTKNATWWNQLYDPKEGRAIRQIPCSGMCKHCGEYCGHKLDCPEVTLEHLAKMVRLSQAQEELSKRHAKRYYEQLQRAVGRVAVLRHENNKLRKANQKLRAELDAIRK
ncbi:hypothetical protein KDA23_02065 [Candidatus Saccharibacteria bacterium]|nr:hypothetical protein [Candidatus Saccharibacteria bacterium]